VLACDAPPDDDPVLACDAPPDDDPVLACAAPPDDPPELACAAVEAVFVRAAVALDAAAAPVEAPALLVFEAARDAGVLFEAAVRAGIDAAAFEAVRDDGAAFDDARVPALEAGREALGDFDALTAAL